MTRRALVAGGIGAAAGWELGKRRVGSGMVRGTDWEFLALAAFPLVLGWLLVWGLVRAAHHRAGRLVLAATGALVGFVVLAALVGGWAWLIAAAGVLSWAWWRRSWPTPPQGGNVVPLRTHRRPPPAP